MDLLFTIGAAWICFTSMSVFAQTNSYGHLMISVGAALTLSTYLLLGSKPVVEVVLVIGEVLFWGGIAVASTFGGALEKDRLRTSSWKEILLGRVPEHLQTNKVSEKVQVVQTFLISLLFAVIFYVGSRPQEALGFLVIAIVFAAYLGSMWDQEKRRE